MGALFLKLFVSLALIATLVKGQGGTRVGFYSSTCPNAEFIVKQAVESSFRNNPIIAAKILRMHFHDCFVEGCDGSILLNGPATEKTAFPNLSLGGFEVIDAAKAQLEATCPGVVSCADILALAARDSVVLAGGPSWEVPTGRRDGTVSLASNVDLPSPFESVEIQRQRFAAFGLNVVDLVALVGGHTIGSASCAVVSPRANNGGFGADPTFLSQLLLVCPANGDATIRVALDQGSSGTFDSSFYNNLRLGHGVLLSDQMLWGHPSTNGLVRHFSHPTAFNFQFKLSMVKMSNIGVKFGNAGQIRRICSLVN